MPEPERDATCSNCPHVHKLPDSTTMVCELAPPIPILMTTQGHQTSPRHEMSHNWMQPRVTSQNSCSHHPHRVAATIRGYAPELTTQVAEWLRELIHLNQPK